MNRTADIAKAREIDTLIAAAWDEFWAIQTVIDDKTKAVKETEKTIRYTRHAAALASLVARSERLGEELKALRPQAAEKREAAIQLDADLYEGWNRFFLVQHIHRSQHCSSFRLTTRVGWLPSVSGLTEAEAVAEHGATLCTICFPSAPVELTTKPVDDTTCPGRRYYDAPSRTGFYTGNWATCQDCGERVTITSTGKLRKHKK
jgi:hypothetical protein